MYWIKCLHQNCCAIPRKFCYKNNELIYYYCWDKEIHEIAQFRSSNIFVKSVCDKTAIINKSRIIFLIKYLVFFPFLGSKHQTRDELAMVLSLPCNEIENGASEIYFGKYKIAHELMKVFWYS